jgi:hypothetical protein
MSVLERMRQDTAHHTILKRERIGQVVNRAAQHNVRVEICPAIRVHDQEPAGKEQATTAIGIEIKLRHEQSQVSFGSFYISKTQEKASALYQFNSTHYHVIGSYAIPPGTERLT